MTLIFKARSLRSDEDEEIFERILGKLTPYERDFFRGEIYKNVESLNENERENITTAILKKTWVGNHLLEYFKKVAQSDSEKENLEKILYRYGFAKNQNSFVSFKDFKNQFSTGFGKDKPKKLFFALATAQQISLLNCFKQFLEFCLDANRPLRYFYTDKDKSLYHYVETLNKLIKAHKNKKEKFELKLTLLEEERLGLKEYIDNIKQYLKNNPEKSEQKADIDGIQNINGAIINSAENTSESDSSISPQSTLSIPDPEEGNINYYANTAYPLIGRGIQKIRLKKFLQCDLEKSQVAWFQLAGAAGQGKSRLAFELMHYALKKLKWRAGFLKEHNKRSFKNKWKKWKPDKPCLFILDDVIGREEEIKFVLRYLIDNEENFDHKVRILLVERQPWNQGIILNGNNQNVYNERFSKHISDKAEWFLKLCGKKDFEGEKLRPYRFQNGVEELEKLDQKHLATIVKGLLKRSYKKTLTLSDEALEETLIRIDSSGRPLYAYLLAQQLSIKEEGYQSWTRIDLLNYQLMRDRRRWENIFKKHEEKAPTWGESHPAMKLAVLATIVRQVNFQDARIKKYFGDMDLPFRKEAIFISNGYLINRNDHPQQIFAMEPDLLGEWFVLFCFYQGLEFEELLDIAWQYSPQETAGFLQRISQDFIDLSKEYNKEEIIEKLFAYKSSYKSHYQVLANVAVEIATKFYKLNLTIPQSILLALKYGANTSDTAAMLLLGLFHWRGIGMARNSKRAFELYQQAAEQGNSNALTHLGVCYAEGIGVVRNYAKAAVLFRQAVKLGNSNAMFHLGNCYEIGEGVIQNSSMAIKLFHQAAKHDDVQALKNLGDCYKNGRGVKKNWNKAISLYQRAADQGDSSALINLGSRYEKGEGVKQDWNKAIDLFQRAVKAGEKKAVTLIQKNLLLQNFLRKGNYESHKINDLSNNKSAQLTGAPEFDPPIMTGGWKQLPLEEVTAYLEKIMPSFEILGLVKYLDGYVIQYARSLPLNFYKDCNLVDLQLFNPSNKDTIIFSAIFNTKSAILLNGKREIISDLNYFLLSLDNKKSTINYLQFYCSHVQSGQGKPFQIIFSLDQIPFHEEVGNEIKDKVKESFFSPRIIEFTPPCYDGNLPRVGWGKFEACVLYENILYVQTFEVLSNGYVSLKDGHYIFENLPIHQRQYDGVFCTPLRS